MSEPLLPVYIYEFNQRWEQGLIGYMEKIESSHMILRNVRLLTNFCVYIDLVEAFVNKGEISDHGEHYRPSASPLIDKVILPLDYPVYYLSSDAWKNINDFINKQVEEEKTMELE